MAFTFFFRDMQILETLISHALPVLQGHSRIRIWDAGCAHGPEPYTLAILLREKMSPSQFSNVRIHATDVDSMFAAQVTEGAYSEGELKRIPADLFKRYFRTASKPGMFQIVDEIRSSVLFSVHDLLTIEPIRGDFHLIVCKNVLLHFQESQRCSVLRMFHSSLCDDGLLATEHTQKMPDGVCTLYRQASSNCQVFFKAKQRLGSDLAPPSIRRHSRWRTPEMA